MKRTIYMNQDNHHFYGCHPPKDMTEEGINALVDFYAEGTQVAGIMFCVNVQRALFESGAWETFWSDYDPKLGDDQPCLSRTHGIKNHLLLRERGLDQFAIWLKRCEYHGIEGWLTMRMNDCHGLKEHVENKEKEPDAKDWMNHWPSTYWREHPELRRAPYRAECSWEHAFDYGKKETRDYHLKLIAELFERYDMFGLELDWMRWGMMFAPGGESEGRRILTGFIREVRELANLAEKKYGHPIKLAHRIPAKLESCLELGYDPIEWAKEGLIDICTLSSFLGCGNFKYSIDIWRAALGGDVKILAHTEAVARPYPYGESRVIDTEFLFGSAASALQRGADGIYLFNECYRESDAPELLKTELSLAGSLDTLAKLNRRIPVGYAQVQAPGEACDAILPIELRQTEPGSDIGRLEDNITLRIAVGRKNESDRAYLRMGFSIEVDDALLANPDVRINTRPIKTCERPRWNSISKEIAEQENHKWNADVPAKVAKEAWFEIPPSHLQDDVNVVELLMPTEGTLEWAEIVLLVDPSHIIRS